MREDAAADGAARRELLVQRRKALGLTQEGLAELLNVDRNTVARWERGEAQPLPWMRPTLAKALKVSPERMEALLAGDESAGPDATSAVVPRQLPAAVADFTGRATELAELTRRVWLDGERANLVAVAAHTCEHGWPGHAARLAVTLFRYLDYGGYYPEAAIIQGHGLSAARHTGDADAELATLNALGLAHLKQGRFTEAANYFQQTLTRGRDAGNRRHEGLALTNLGIASFLGGSYRKAPDHLQQALSLCRETGDPVGEAIVLHNLSIIDWRQGRYQQATGHCRQAIALCRETGDRDTEVHVLVSLGAVDLRLGRYRQATDRLQRALALWPRSRPPGDR